MPLIKTAYLSAHFLTFNGRITVSIIHKKLKDFKLTPKTGVAYYANNNFVSDIINESYKSN
jgi:hypothetical protein